MKSHPPHPRGQALAGLACATALLAFATGGLAQSSADEPPLSRAQSVQRLVIQYNQGELELLSQHPLVKVLPPSDELPAVQIPGPRQDPDEEAPNELPAVQLPSGFWFEVVMGDGSVRYRRIIENPILLAFEGINPEEKHGVLERVESVPKQRIFSILVPVDRGDADTSVVFFSSPLEPGAQARAAAAIGRVVLQPLDQGPFFVAISED